MEDDWLPMEMPFAFSLGITLGWDWVSFQKFLKDKSANLFSYFLLLLVEKVSLNSRNRMKLTFFTCTPKKDIAIFFIQKIAVFLAASLSFIWRNKCMAASSS